MLLQAFTDFINCKCFLSRFARNALDWAISGLLSQCLIGVWPLFDNDWDVINYENAVYWLSENSIYLESYLWLSFCRKKQRLMFKLFKWFSRETNKRLQFFFWKEVFIISYFHKQSSRSFPFFFTRPPHLASVAPQEEISQEYLCLEKIDGFRPLTLTHLKSLNVWMRFLL